jgi:outer membrane protein TolC
MFHRTIASEPSRACVADRVPRRPHPHSHSHLRRLAASLLLGLACSALRAEGLVSPEPSAAATAAAIAAEADRPWWWAFHDASLNLLLAPIQAAAAADRTQALELQAQAAAEYVKARVYTVRGHTARTLRESAERQLKLLQDADRGDTDAARFAAATVRQSAEREQQFAELRAASMGALAAALGGRYLAQELAVLLEPALDDTRLPVPEVDFPERVSGIVLRRRPDVMEAESHLALSARGSGSGQLRLAQYLQALSQEIGPDDAAAAPGEAQDGATAPERVLVRARFEIGAGLRQLATTNEVMTQQATYARDVQQKYDRIRQTFVDGTTSEVDILGALEDVLVEEDRLAATMGGAALAWIAYQQSIGGAGEARMSDLLGADSDDED